MLLELAAANAAFAVIKEAVSNGKELWDAGSAVTDYFTNKNKISQQVQKKGAARTDLEEFMALEQLKRQEEELKELMIYSGRGGMWDDWIAFQADAKRKRDDEAKTIAKAKRLRKQKIHDWIVGISAGVAILSGIGLIGYIFYYIAVNSK
jgi:hypothetical protein